jgi:hypothetical protein
MELRITYIQCMIKSTKFHRFVGKHKKARYDLSGKTERDT